MKLLLLAPCVQGDITRSTPDNPSSPVPNQKTWSKIILDLIAMARIMPPASLNPLTTNFPHHIEPSQLICKSIDWFLYDVEHWSLMG